MTFCWLPPESVPAVMSIEVARMSYSSMCLAALSLMASMMKREARRIRGAVVNIEHEVVGERETLDDAVLLAVLGDVAHAGLEHNSCPGACQILSRDNDRTGSSQAAGP